jgi:hypothetical protein
MTPNAGSPDPRRAHALALQPVHRTPKEVAPASEPKGPPVTVTGKDFVRQQPALAAVLVDMALAALRRNRI